MKLSCVLWRFDDSKRWREDKQSQTLTEMWIYDESMTTAATASKLVAQDKISVGTASESGQQGGEGHDSIAPPCTPQFLTQPRTGGLLVSVLQTLATTVPYMIRRLTPSPSAFWEVRILVHTTCSSFAKVTKLGCGQVCWTMFNTFWTFVLLFRSLMRLPRVRLMNTQVVSVLGFQQYPWTADTSMHYKISAPPPPLLVQLSILV